MIGPDSLVTWDDDRGAYVADFDAEGLPPSIVVAEVLNAAREGSDPPLFDYVDPDALDALATDSDPSLRISFPVDDLRVTVRGDGLVLARPA